MENFVPICTHCTQQIMYLEKERREEILIEYFSPVNLYKGLGAVFALLSQKKVKYLFVMTRCLVEGGDVTCDDISRFWKVFRSGYGWEIWNFWKTISLWMKAGIFCFNFWLPVLKWNGISHVSRMVIYTVWRSMSQRVIGEWHGGWNLFKYG